MRVLNEQEVAELYKRNNINVEKKKNTIGSKILAGIKYTVFTPLGIATNIVSAILKFVGTLLSIGLPYGFYCAYKVTEELLNGISYIDTKHNIYLEIFFFSPFIAFLLSLLFRKLSDYFTYNS